MIVTGITLNAGWKEENSLSQDYRSEFLRQNFKKLDIMVEVYRQKHHHIPQKLSDLKDQEMYYTLASSGTVVDDYWRKPIVYQSDGSKYSFISYGRDGKPGGEGLDLDISSLFRMGEMANQVEKD